MSNVPPPPFALMPGERMHPLWLKLKDHFETTLAKARCDNDDPSLTEAQTAALRGRIKCLKAMIRLGDDKPPIDG